MILGCGGKTTVREEMIDTTPREDKTEAKSEQPVEAPDEQKQEPDEEEKTPDPRPAPGTDPEPEKPYRPPVGPGLTPGRDNAGGKEAREKYMDNQLSYPGSQPSQMPSMPPSAGHSGKTVMTDDPPEQVAGWYANKFGNMAKTNQTDEFGTSMTIIDKVNGYKSDVVIQKSGTQGKTLIIIHVEDI